jgi:outer membrane protein assembly complex protein YaeT
VLALAGGLVAAAPAASRAQPAGPLPSDPAAYAGQAVAEVVIERAATRVDDPRWLALVESQPGAPLSLRAVRESLLHFYFTGLFESVGVAAERAGTGGVRLIYRLTPQRSVTAYEFRGDLGLPARELRALVVDRFGPRTTPVRAAAAAEVLVGRLREHGFASARVTPAIEAAPGSDTATLRFDVAAGPRSRLGSIRITGQPLEPPARVLAELDVATGAVHDGPAIERRLDGLRTRMRRLGYYEASAVARATPRPGQPITDLEVDIQPGPLVTLRFEGDPLPEDRRAELVPVEREASVDEDLLEDSKRRIEAYLRALGHWRAEVAYRREAAADRLAIVFTVRAGPVYRVARFRLAGAQAFTAAEIQAVLGVQEGGLLVEGELDARTAALRERYRRAGFRSVRIDQEIEILEPAAARGDEPPEGRVEVRLLVSEGERVRVGTVRLAGTRAVAESTLRPSLQLQPGTPFYEPLVAADREALASAYLDRGYDRVRVDASLQPAADRPVVDVTYTVQEGEQVRVGRILIVGNRRTDAETIERALALKPGEPLGLAQIFESQRRLRALGLFRRVTLTDVGEAGDTRRDLVVAVEEAAPTSIGYGAGIEAGRYLRQDEPGGQATERLELAGRGFFEIGRQNLFGSNRSVNLFTRLSLRPSGVAQASGGSDFGFNEYRVLLSFRDPSAFGAADTRVTGYFEQAVRSSFNFVRRGLLVEGARRLRGRLSLAGSYSLSEVRLYDERIAPEDRPDIDRLFPQVRLSKFTTAARFDTRDDLLDPTTGFVMGIDGDLAMRALGSQVGFVKGYGEFFTYHTVATRRRLVVALGARIGLARGFERSAPRLTEEGDPILDAGGTPIVDVVSDLPASERFFAGGDTSVRGYARDSLGDPDTLDPNGFPTGGHGLVIVNAELRAPIWKALGGVLFLDAGNVFRRVGGIDAGELRPSAGFGLRYKSPVGPVRMDVGFKLDERQSTATGRERGYAVHFSIGQAF